MTIKEIMQFGTSGMNSAQRMEEQERRIAVSVRINHLYEKVVACEGEARKVEKESPTAKMLKNKIRNAKKELNRIKADESTWLREAAWFMYA